MKKQFKILSLLALGLSLSVNGQEQEQDTISSLDEVVLYGLKVPQKEALIGKNITVLKEGDLEAYRGQSVAQLINTVSGITIQGAQLPMGNSQSIYARGGRSKQVLILIDGIRVADPYSASLSYDLRLLDLSQIKQIEVLKGASSAVYGTAASTVVIAITTKAHSDHSLVLKSGIGSNQTAADQNMAFNYKSLGLSHSGSLGELNYRIDYSNLGQGGISALEDTTEEDPFKRSQLAVVLSSDQKKSFSWKLNSSYTDMNAAYDDSFNGIDEAFEFNTIRKAIGFQSTYRLEQGSLFFGINHNQFNSEAISSFPGAFSSKTTNIDTYYKTSIGTNLRALIGVQTSKDASKSINDSSVQQIDPYVSLFYSAPSGININSSVRLNKHETYGSHWVGSFNPSYTLLGDKGSTVFYTSIASAFISPSHFQLYGEWGANPTLTPEENTTYEAGIKTTNENNTWNLLFFKRDETNAVFWDTEAFGYANSEGESTAKGVEFDMTNRISDEFSIKSNYTYLLRDEQLMIRIPKHKFNLSLNYQLDDHRFLLQTQYVGERTDTDFSTYSDVVLDPYTLINFNWNYDLNESLALQCGIQNIFNKAFIEQVGYQSLGRNYRINLIYNLF